MDAPNSFTVQREDMLAHDLNKKIYAYTKKINRDPKSFLSFTWRAEALMKLGKFDLALEDIEKAINLIGD